MRQNVHVETIKRVNVKIIPKKRKESTEIIEILSLPPCNFQRYNGRWYKSSF